MEMSKEYLELQDLYNKIEDKYSVLLNNYSTLESDFDEWKKQSVKWGIEDFLTMNEDESEYEITAERAKEALEHMINKHDAEMGITWTTVEHYYREYRTEKEEIENDGIFK